MPDELHTSTTLPLHRYAPGVQVTVSMHMPEEHITAHEAIATHDPALQTWMSLLGPQRRCPSVHAAQTPAPEQVWLAGHVTDVDQS